MSQSVTNKILVWDAPTRLFHWLMVFSFAGAYITSEGERWRLVHVTLGYTMGGLLAFRMVWGLMGTRYARFSNFVRGPQAVMAYLRSLHDRPPQHFIGHNPAGAVAIVLLIVHRVLSGRVFPREHGHVIEEVIVAAPQVARRRRRAA